jgi:hypothetical protein
MAEMINSDVSVPVYVPFERVKILVDEIHEFGPGSPVWEVRIAGLKSLASVATHARTVLKVSGIEDFQDPTELK